MSFAGTVTLLPQADATLTSRPVLIQFDNGESVTVDMIVPGTMFTVPVDAATGVAIPTGSINPVGTGPAGAPFPFVIPSEGTVPLAEVVTGVSFSPTEVNPLKKGKR